MAKKHFIKLEKSGKIKNVAYWFNVVGKKEKIYIKVLSILRAVNKK